MEKPQEPGVLVKINRNKEIMEPFNFLVNEALLNVSQGVSTSNDAFPQQKKNDGVEEELQNTANDILDDDLYIYHSQDNFDVPISQSIFISD